MAASFAVCGVTPRCAYLPCSHTGLHHGGGWIEIMIRALEMFGQCIGNGWDLVQRLG